ncbi:flagellar hook capping FlgD N-terminal domain-containing protein [Amnibacterium kyonggiense]|uniref:Flagellar basal-body rod modification protein FlgD n=1 Tax=Amnibacterium kyonggiense TaxID=595671 RepID=A0A4R7FQW0_9MICO|nr:flagellar hook capping FlgD N-terminal domain-containing protein [Amnibacterium kyonggiense]TDS80078.1 flagellar basal-body rod modification protein FlgD [Amnibacterium kyonggiense]
MTDSTGATVPGASLPPATSIYSNGSATTPKANQEYNSQLFLKLLVTQLANQDPSSPMDSAQMVSQTAQLASMEQMTSLNATTTSNYQTQMQATATSMLGKTVTWTDKDGAAQSGVVSAIAFSSTGKPQLTVGSSAVGLDAVTGVKVAA